MSDTPRNIRARGGFPVYTGVMENEPRERSAREAREHFADMINDAIQGRITYVTSNGRRVAAVVPLTEVIRRCEADRPTVTP